MKYRKLNTASILPEKWGPVFLFVDFNSVVSKSSYCQEFFFFRVHPIQRSLNYFFLSNLLFKYQKFARSLKSLLDLLK